MRILILFVVLSTTWQAYAQNLQVRYRPCNPCGTNLNDDFEYGEAVVFPTESVISDYGIRHVNSGSTFHQAIDYTVRGEEDAKYALQAVNGGTITSISKGNNGGYKIIKVGNYGYGHIFSNPSSNISRFGKFLLAKLDKINLDEWAIIDLEFCRCFAETPNEYVTVNDLDLKFCNKKVFTTTNEVETGWDIAPLGISGTPYSHLHLERYVGGTGRRADPNQYVAHAETDFEVILKSETSDDNEVKLTYPGTKPSPLRVRAKMIGATKIHSDGYTNVTMSVDNVGILIERNGQSGYEEIIGPKYNSRIGIGARDDSPLTPWNESGFNAQHNNKKFGSWDRMGIRPFAHNDVVTPTNLRNEPYDDYFFADFYTRIHKDKHDAFTDIPSNARYNDGKYNLKPTVTNVRDELFTIPGIDVTLDNYLPYLTEVNIKYNGEVLYQAERVGNEGTKSPDDGFVMNHIHEYPIPPGQMLPNTLTIEIKTSEPMQNVKYAYKQAGQITIFPSPILMTPHPVDKLIWTGTIPSVNMDACYNVQFKGQDLSGNEIIHTYASTNQNARDVKMMIPTRMGVGAQDWNNMPVYMGEDQVDFCFSDCRNKFQPDRPISLRGGGSNACQPLTTLTSSVGYISCIKAQISLDGTGFISSLYMIRWTDGQDNPLPQYDDMAVIQVAASGLYCFYVEAKDDCCNVSGCVEVMQGNMDESSFELQTALQHSCRTTIQDGAVDLDIIGGVSPFQVDWYRLSDDEPLLLQSHTGVTNGSGAEDLTGMPIGHYAVVVMDQNGCSQEASYEILNNGISIGLPDTIVVCAPGTGEIIPDVSGGLGIYEYLWSTGDTDDALYGMDAGTYTVTVTDEGGCSAEATVAFVASSPIVFADNFELHKPTSCESEDGYISTWRGGNISGGTLPYSYLWNTGSTNNSIGPVVAGTYTLTVTDAVGCTAVKEQALYAENGIEIGYEDIKNTCKDVATGRIHIVFSDNVDVVCNELGLSLFNVDELYLEPLGKGFFNFNIKGSDSDCFLYKTYEIKEKENIEIIDIVQSYYPCKGDNTAIAEVILNNLGQINIQWKNLDSGEIVSTSKKPTKLAPGLYEVSVTDVECMHTSTRTIEIEDNGFPGIESVEGDVTCVLNVPGGSWESGKVNITAVEGGTAPYSYYWNGQNGAGPDIYPFGSGTYTVTVTDANRCTFVKSFIVNKSDQELKADITIENPNGCETKITEMDVHVKILSGNPPYVIYFKGETYETDENDVVIKTKPELRSDGFWQKNDLYIKIKDACDFEYVEYFSIECSTLCKSCIEIGVKNPGPDGICFMGPNNRLRSFGYSHFKVTSKCDNHDINVYSPRLTEHFSFNGKGSKTSNKVLYQNDGGAYLFDVYDNTTGCYIAEWFWAELCRDSKIKWIVDNLGGGGDGGGGGGGNTTCNKAERQFIEYTDDECGYKSYCPKNGKYYYDSGTLKYFSFWCQEESRYHNYMYCPVGCRNWYLGWSDKKLYKTTSNCTFSPPCIGYARPNFDPPTCLDTVKDLILDTIENKYVAFWNDTDSLGNNLIKGYSFTNTPALKDDGESYAMFKSDLDISFVRVDDRENYYVVGKNNGNFLNKYNRDGLLLWTIPITENKVSNVIQENNQLILVSTDERQSSTYDEEGKLLYVSSLPINATFMDFDKTAKSRYIGYQELTHTVSIYDSNSVYSAVIPENIKVKSVKFRNEEEIVVIAEFKDTIKINGNEYNTNGITKPILIIYDKLCNIKNALVPDRAADVTIDIGYVNESEIILYGQIRNTPNDLDSTVLEDCNYLWVLSLDSTECTTFTSELTFDQELCELSWDNVPEGYTTTLEYISNDSVWISALPIDGKNGFVSPYRISRDATYRLVHQKPGCRGIISNEVSANCNPSLCPEISFDIVSDTCFVYDVTSAAPHNYRVVIKTWQEDSNVPQFLDTVYYYSKLEHNQFIYCNLPEEYRCYNTGKIVFTCLDCAESCTPVTYDWSCQARVSNTKEIEYNKTYLSIHPNPFGSGVYIDLRSEYDDNYTLVALNNIGQIQFVKEIEIRNGDNPEYISEFEGLPAGVYTIELKNKYERLVRRVIKVN